MSSLHTNTGHNHAQAGFPTTTGTANNSSGQDQLEPHLPRLESAQELLPGLQRLRREIHADPEVGLNLPRTREHVLTALQGLDLEIELSEHLSSVTAVLRGGQRSTSQPRAVLLRGDMDALPVMEATGLDFASRNGNMHACGHDLHISGLVGAVQLLHDVHEHLHGDVIFMFQPGEEGYDGAGKMLAAGVLEAAGVPVVGAYGVHVSPDQPSGFLHSKPGTVMASYSRMDITIKGKGGHASRPHTTLDPIQVGAAVVSGLQDYVTRRFDVFDPLVVTVGEFHAGSAANVVPDDARMAVSVRAFSQESVHRAESELPALVQGLAQSHGLDAEVIFDQLLPPTINDDEHADFYLETFADLFGEERTVRMQNPRSGSEDFSRVLQATPGAFGHLGVALPGTDPQTWESSHSPRARHSDEVLGEHALFLAHLAARRLSQVAKA